MSGLKKKPTESIAATPGRRGITVTRKAYAAAASARPGNHHLNAIA
ncbi:hypothetical protein QFZ26_002978 [Agromyces ramosus]|uniref:Uncharacterized protein n=1 Tax=Agromyces ramosus TaxID=33879 RepID=A0ABU0RBH2_9MICO|nr:hypothetical protein [Agromyces ramosus]MDQ0895423.1 hypothetical protein [Agromyces ramosus]